jgi:uncharacterized coiled-coil protein SlyX
MPDKTDKTSNQVLIKEIKVKIQEMKRDTSTIREDLAYIKEKLKEKEDKNTDTIQETKGWFW